ncbi:hypothetical protein HY464_00750, partial [Candidatus Peregrinibacteria bacterium]|nr:hypothetical protein [Candidatus Peregrinibacteria bacterium]
MSDKRALPGEAKWGVNLSLPLRKCYASGSTPYPSLPFIVLDTETTGLFPRVHKIVELAFVHVENGKVTDQYEQLYDIDDDIPPHVQVLTRIRPEDLQGQPKLEEHVKKIQSLIGSDTLLIGQNLGFDLDMLRAEGLDLREYPWIDTSMLASLVFPELASYSLGYMSVALRLRHDPVHRALGDVRATLELFGRIWERMEALPTEHLTILRETFAQSTSGYQRLAEYLPQSSNARRFPWSLPARENIGHDVKPFPIPPVTSGTVLLLEDSLDPHTIHHLINTLRNAPHPNHSLPAGRQVPPFGLPFRVRGPIRVSSDELMAERRGEGGSQTHTAWVAVKNLEATLRRVRFPADIRVLHPPFLLLDPEAAERLQEQTTFTADEATLAVKLHWFPARVREDLQIHGGERDVWNGKLACTDISPLYASQFENLPTVILLDHRQLLHCLADREHRALSALRPDHLVVIDDASMLEDTATKAYGYHVTVSDLRAAAVGHAALTKFIDLLELWVEKVRGNDDVHLLGTRDFTRKETKGLREQLAGHIGDASLPHRTQEHLHSLVAILSENTGTRLTWIECRQHKTTLHAAPENTAELLHQNLFSRFPTVLLSPPGFTSIPETTQGDPAVHPSPLSPTLLPISYPENSNVTAILENPPRGKTVLLLPSKRIIEEQFVRFTERLEKQGITLICQGLSGGQGRMEAEFAAAAAPAILLLTPWTYEGFELLMGTVDHLIVDSLPFDHPSDLLIQMRSKHYTDAFTEYTLP